MSRETESSATSEVAGPEGRGEGEGENERERGSHSRGPGRPRRSEWGVYSPIRRPNLQTWVKDQLRVRDETAGNASLAMGYAEGTLRMALAREHLSTGMIEVVAGYFGVERDELLALDTLNGTQIEDALRRVADRDLTPQLALQVDRLKDLSPRHQKAVARILKHLRVLIVMDR